MSTRDELAARLGELYAPDKTPNDYYAADALIAEGWRKKPNEAEVIAVLDDDMNWDVGELSPVLLMKQTARAILALMDRGQ